MIQASELRMGNWLSDPDRNTDFTIDIGDILEIRKGCPKGFKYEPIPLTKDWLVKFGFEEINTTYFLPTRNEFRISFSKAGVHFGFSIDKTTTRYFKIIKHVHQLQNLYFAITNQELEINVPLSQQNKAKN